MAEAQRRRRLATLEEYLSSLAAGNPAWRHKAMQKNDTFIGRLEREDCRGRSEGVHCRPAPSQAPDSGASTPPVQLLWSPEEGRHLVASRDIAAGEDIFREPPLVLTPRPHPEPVCLACLAPLKADWSGCEGCGAPLCSPPCDGELHVVSECGMLAGLGLQQDRDQLLPLNQLLTTTRTLLLLQEAPQAGHVIEAMQSNVEKRQRSVVAQAMEKRVMEGLRRLGMEEEEGVVRHICGVFDTNAFAVDGGRALLPLAALMNHHCSANTQHWFHRGTLVVRAARNIPKGEAITNTYTPVLWGNRARAAYLASSKLFTCRCERCLDPRELGSHLSSVRCRQCQGGVLLPPSSPAETVWQCESCGENVAAAAVEAMVRAAATMAKGAVGDAEELQAVVCQMTRLVGECHYVTVGAKHSLVETIMAGRLHDVSGADLRRVVDLCGDLLHIADLLEPGLSRLRGVLLLEQVRAAAELLRRQTAADFSAISSVTDTEETTATITSTSTSTAFDITCDESAPSQLSLIQKLKAAATESENILQYDPRLPHAQEVLRLLQELQANGKAENEEKEAKVKKEEEGKEGSH